MFEKINHLIRTNAEQLGITDIEAAIKGFAETVKDYTDDGEQMVVKFHLNKKRGNVTFLTKDRESSWLRVCRCFPIYDKWNVSVDAEGEPLDVVNKLIEFQARML